MDKRVALPKEWIERLFERLMMIYGTEKFQGLWRGQDIEEVKDFWARELAEFADADLRGGFSALQANYPSWPPTLYEFADLCKAAIKPVAYQALPWPAFDPATVNPKIAELAKVLTGERQHPRAWADKLLKREADGVRTLDWYALKLARECVAMTQRGE